MLKVRVIPTLLWKNLGLVKGVGFDSWRRVGAVLPSIKVYNIRDVDELVLLDISATKEGRVPDEAFVKSCSAHCFVPLTVGGGITSLEQIAMLLRSGADKISLNSSALATPEVIDAASRRFGSQCVVVSIDAKVADGQLRCVAQSGASLTSRTPVQWAREVADRGAGEILLTSVDRDGTMEGYDLELISEICNAVNIPVIASGGAGNYQHMVEAVKAGASAVAAASMFHFTEQTPAQAKRVLSEAGIPVRNGYTSTR